MSQQQKAKKLLTLPPNAGRAIVKAGATIACPILGTDKFIKFCKDRGVSVDRERLIRLERLGLFAPLFRVCTPQRSMRAFSIPPAKDNDWFKKKWAWDCTSVQTPHKIPDPKDRSQQGYYSIFQIDHLALVLNSMSLSVSMDSFLETECISEIDWNRSGKRWLRHTRMLADGLRDHEYRRSVALLCQFISDRYYPEIQGDQRTIQVPQRHYSDEWINVNAMGWDWHDYCRRWRPKKVEQLFKLTPEKLRHAYNGMAIAQSSCDPLERWYQLIQFINLSERGNLKGDALRAETLRAGAHMLRLLNKDLYGEDLPHPNEVTGTIIMHVPELEVRADTRRYLEFVANRYGVNPQPKVSLIVEGETEELAICKILEEAFGIHPGKLGIEVIALGGVDFATGGRADRFRAILRLVDYLHHHQTLAFLILDNENYAKRLKAEARKATSIHHKGRHVTRPEYIKIWNQSFEMDNFSATEIANALTQLSLGRARFTRSEIASCKQDKKRHGILVSELYERKAGRGIEKLKLIEILVKGMLAPNLRRKLKNRPIVQTLERVAELAQRNPFPTMLDIWVRNQASKHLGTRKR